VTRHRLESSASTAQLPLILRRESFGGVLFDPSDATYLELDEEAFGFVHGWLRDGRQPRSKEELRLLAELHKEAAGLQPGARSVRFVDEAPLATRYANATVLASPTLVDLQITRRCHAACPHCYMSADATGNHMDFEEARRVFEELAKAGVGQVAIGGGEPLLHPRLADLLACAHAEGLVPNLTTTGDALTPELLVALGRYCGAVGLSLESVGADFAKRRRFGFAFFERVLQTLSERGVATVLQVTLSAENVSQLPSIVDFCLACPPLYGVIFLAYKPVGRGRTYNSPLASRTASSVYPLLREALARLEQRTRVGYDCCFTPGIVGLDLEFGFRSKNLLEGCSAARSSLGITTELDVVPCTFTADQPLGNLRRQSLLDIWRGQSAEDFRHELDRQVDDDAICRTCAVRASCLGGCPRWRLVRCSQGGPMGVSANAIG
jgi:radical SAM protein with 4Fe4S-binding SPASM domain